MSICSVIRACLSRYLGLSLLPKQDSSNAIVSQVALQAIANPSSSWATDLVQNAVLSSDPSLARVSAQLNQKNSSNQTISQIGLQTIASTYSDPSSSSSSRITDLVQNAVLSSGPSMPLTPIQLNQVANLEVLPNVVPAIESNKSQDFFAVYIANLDRAPTYLSKFLSGLQEVDIAYLKQLMQEHCLTNQIGFHDLFGMEFYRLLKAFKPYLSKPRWSQLTQEWATLYCKGFLGLFRCCIPQFPPMSVHTKQQFCIAQDYNKALQAFTQKLRTELETRNTNQPNFQPHLVKWEQGTHVLEKFLGDEEIARTFLLDRNLVNCPGSHAMNPQSMDDVAEVWLSLRNFTELVRRTISDNEIPAQFFDKIGSIEKSPSAKECTDLQKSIPMISMDLQKNFQKNYALRKSLETNSKKAELVEPALEKQMKNLLFGAWLGNFSQVIDYLHSMVDPSRKISLAYLNRFFQNLIKIDRLPKVSTSENPVFNQLYSSLKNFWSLPQIQNPIRILKQFNYEAASDYALMQPQIDALHKALKPWADDCRKKLSKLKLIEEEEPLWITQILILISDMEVYLYQKPASEEDILPEYYLKFLGIIEDAPAPKSSSKVKPPSSPPKPLKDEIDESPTSSDETHSTSSYVQQQKDETMTLSQPTPPLISTQKKDKIDELPQTNKTDQVFIQSQPHTNAPAPIYPSSNSSSSTTSNLVRSRRSTTPAVQQDHSVSSSFSSSSSPLEELELPRKRRHLEKVLKNLGLEPIRNPNHTIWRGNGMQTTVPHHDEIRPGTLQSIARQLSLNNNNNKNNTNSNS